MSCPSSPATRSRNGCELTLGLIAGEACRRSRRLRQARAPARARSSAPPPPRRPARGRAGRARCASISHSKPASSTPRPCSAASSVVRLEREAEGVVQREGILPRRSPASPPPGAVDQLVEQPGALLQRAPETLLLGGEPLLDRLALLEQFGVGAAHQLAHDVGVADQEPRRHLQARACRIARRMTRRRT